MNTSEKEFSPHESLLVIRSMIETTRNSLSNDSPYYLVWGWAVLLACLTQFVLIRVHYPNHSLAWGLILVALVIYLVMIAKRKKNERVTTFVDEASGYLWTALGSCFMVFPFIFSKIGWQYCLPFYILIYGVGTYVSARLMKFKPMAIGGVLCFPLAAVSPYFTYDYQLLIAAVAILSSYIIPGHILGARYHKSNTA